MKGCYSNKKVLCYIKLVARSSEKKNTGAGRASVRKEQPATGREKMDAALLLRKPFVHILLIAALGFFVYSNTFHGSFHWDDFPQIANNPVIKTLDNFVSNSKGYRFNPRRFIGYLTFALNYYADGGSVIGYHVVNLAIHLINSLILYFLVLLTFKTPNMRRSASATGPPPILIALFSALLFVSHPVQTEAVTYIVQRLASLAAMFYLLSLLMYIEGRLKLNEAEGKRNADKFAFRDIMPAVPYALCSLLFAVLAMKTKETAFTLPFVIILYEFTFFRSSPKKKLLFLLPVLLTLVIIPLSVLHSGRSLGELLSDVTHQTRVQTSMSRWDYLMTEVSVVATYVRLLFFPVNQNLDYDYPHYQSLLAPQVLFPFLFLLAVFGLGVYLFIKGKEHGQNIAAGEAAGEELETKPYAPYYRLVSFGIFWFFITLSVESSLIPIVDVIFEHRVYLPSVGFFVGLTAGAFIMADRLKKEKALKAALVLVLLAFSVMTYSRNKVWKNETSLWEDVVVKSPDKARPHSNLGYFYMEDGRLDKAEKHLQAALRLKPDYVEALTSLGNVYLMEGRRDEALRELKTALKLNPKYTEAHINLGNLYSAEGRLDEALGEYETVLRLNPDHAEAHTSLGNVYLMKGLKDKALREYRTALKVNPDDFQTHNNLGNLYFMQGQLDQAVRQYQIALKLNPAAEQTRRNLMTAYRKQSQMGEAGGKIQGSAPGSGAGPADEHRNLANIYYSQGRLDEAVREYRAFLKLNPDSAEAHNDLGNVYYKQGRLDEALVEYQAALKLSPKSSEVHNNLGKIYGRQGHLDKALKEFQAAVKLNPDFADAHNMLGNVYGLQGRMDKALKEYETALKLNPGSAETHNNIGTIYYRQGLLDKARDEFQTALRLKPGDPWASRNLEALNKKEGVKR